jgi:hypothetical protein
MVIPPQMIPFLIQAGTGVAKSGSRLLQPKFGNTKYGNYLQGVKKQGNYTTGQENQILNKVGSSASNQAMVSTNQAYGKAISQGMGNSIANRRMIKDSDLDVRRQITNVGKDIDISEAVAKQDAKMQYAQAVDKDNTERRNAVMGMVGAVGEAGMGYLGAKYGQNMPSDPNTIAQDMIKDGKSAKEIKDILMMLKAMQEKGGVDPSKIDIMSSAYNVPQNPIS